MNELGQLPMTIAVTGHDPEGVTLLARELATVLKYPLIAGDDISPAISSFGIKFPKDVNEFVALTAACQIAKSQLTSVRISVIIKAVVTRALPFHMIEELIEEVACGTARLIVARDVQREGETLRLSIQAGKKKELKLTLRDQTVDVEDFVRFLRDSTAPTIPVDKSSSSQGQIEGAPKFRSKNDHLHKLILSTRLILHCKRCSKPIDGTHYQCLLCQAFPLHYHCAASRPISAVEDFVCCPGDSTAPTIPVDKSSSSQGQIEGAPKCRSKNDHLRELILSTPPILHCKRCSEPICGTHYLCLLCQAFPPQNECATSRPISAVEKCPCYLLENPPRYDFPHALRNKCNNCAEFQGDCYNCLLETVLKNDFLPMILCHPLHKEHPLSFTIMPHSFNYGYQCRVCGKLGKSASYKCCCGDCNFDLHLKCSSLPRTLELKN